MIVLVAFVSLALGAIAGGIAVSLFAGARLSELVEENMDLRASQDAAFEEIDRLSRIWQPRDDKGRFVKVAA